MNGQPLVNGGDRHLLAAMIDVQDLRKVILSQFNLLLVTNKPSNLIWVFGQDLSGEVHHPVDHLVPLSPTSGTDHYLCPWCSLELFIKVFIPVPFFAVMNSLALSAYSQGFPLGDALELPIVLGIEDKIFLKKRQ